MNAHRLALVINALAIFAAGATAGREAARHAASTAPPSLRAAPGRGGAAVHGAPARRSLVTAPLPAGLRATLALPPPPFYSP
jgi:hypothetical protein